MDMMTVLMHTDLPDPVVPAIRQWGIFVMSVTSGSPDASLPRKRGMVVLETKRGSVSLLQRRLTIGYSRASRLIEMMAAMGIVGDYKGSQAREANYTLEEWEAMKEQKRKDEESGMTV